MALAAIQKCGFQLIEHPSYSPDLAPSDYYLFTKKTKELSGHYFVRDYDVRKAANHFQRDQNSAFYTEGIRLLHDLWTNCVNVGVTMLRNDRISFYKTVCKSREGRGARSVCCVVAHQILTCV